MIELYMDKLNDLLYQRQQILEGKKMQNIKNPNKLKIREEDGMTYVEN